MRFRAIFGLFLIFYSIFVLSSRANEASGTYYIQVHGEVNPAQRATVQRYVKEATENDARAIVFGIDTMGGRVDAAIEITKVIESIDHENIFAFVEDKAWSAGAMIALACPNIYMAKSSSMGSAAPVDGQSAETLGEKHVSAIRTKFAALAEANNHNPDIAKAMVDDDIVLKEVKLGDDKQIIDESRIDEIKGSKRVKELRTIIEKDKLLNLTADEALKMGLSDKTYATTDELIQEFSSTYGPVKVLEPTTFDLAIQFLTSTMVSSLLLSLGFIFIYTEFQVPGIGWAGILGVLFLGIVFGGHYLIEYTSLLEVVLFGLGVLCILFEIFLVPGFGLFGVIGALCIFVALYMAMVPFGVPQEPWDRDLLVRTLLMVMGSIVVSVLGSTAIVANAHKIPFLRRFVLQSEIGVTPKEFTPRLLNVKVGDEGVALTKLRPVGKGKFEGGIYDVVSKHGMIDEGAKVKVIEVHDNDLKVIAI